MLQRKIILDFTWRSLLSTEAASVEEENSPRVKILTASKKTKPDNCTFLHPAWATLYKTALKKDTNLRQLFDAFDCKVLIALRLPRSSQFICLETHSHSGLRV